MSVLMGKTTETGAGDQHVLLTSKAKTGEEESRAFLTFSSSGDDIDSRSSINSVEQGVCRRSRGGVSVCGRGSCHYLTACLIVSVLLLAVTVLALDLYRSHEVVELRSQLDAMRRDVESLKHRILEEDLLEQLKAFEDAVYAEEAATEDDDDDDDDSDNEDDSLSDEYDVDYDVDDEAAGRPTHGKKQYGEKSGEERHKHNQDLPAGSAGRSKREIPTSVVPVISESYGVDFNHQHNNSEGLRLYESLVSSGGKNEPKDKSLDWGSTENPIKNYHRVSPLWTSKTPHKKYVGNDAPSYRRHRDRSHSTTGAPSPMISRVSRVMQTDSSDALVPPPAPSPPAPLKLHPEHKLPDGEVVVRVYQEHRGSPGATVSGPGKAITVEGSDSKPRLLRRKKHRPQRKNLAHLEGLDEHPARPARILAAAHYDGDTSKYKLGHTHYDGNGRLRHPDGKFTDWAPSRWMQQLGMSRFFSLQDGVVTVQESGIYFVYAQIYYVDEHDVNGFRVYLNTEPVLHCTTMTVHSSGEQRRAKSNTCHTSAAMYLAPGDQISVRDVDGLRYSLFEPAKSFFGLIKLGDAKIK